MRFVNTRWSARAAAALGACALVALAIGTAGAADHRETGNTADNPAGDIADVYAWHNSTAGTLTTVVTFAGGSDIPASTSALYEDDVLYTIHIDNADTPVPEHNIYVRFGQNSTDAWGMKVDNLPGTTASITGAVETILTSGAKAKAWVGHRDDPFFFDLEGFRTTLQTGTLSFDDTRDSFLGKNVTAIVLEMDLAAAKGSGDRLNIWASTGRK